MLVGAFLPHPFFLMRRACVGLCLVITVGGCGNTADGDAAALDTNGANASLSITPGDSALSMDEQLRQFQAGLPRQDTLTAASSAREALTQRYLEALARFDTAALRDMHITRAEYAHLYFPSSKMMKPPYELPPDVAWLLLTAESNKGIGAVVRRFGGQHLKLESVRCPGDVLREGPNVVWRDCVVRYRGEGNAERERPLFAAIIERDGRFKFFSYATPL